MKGKEDYLDFIFENIRKGKIVLFLGAGASISAGAPSTKDLVKQLHDHFTKIDNTIQDFNELCDAISYTDIYGYNALYEYLQNKFMNLNPSDNHKLISKYDWLAIFTTNYDTLIEQGFRDESRLKSPKVIRTIQDKFNPFRRDVCHIVKLNGCASRNSNEEGKMALTKIDIEETRKIKEEHYQLLLEAIKDGCLLFIGYSFNDLLALGVMNEAINKLGERNIPYSFAFFPNLSSMEEWRLNRLKAMKIIPIEENFEDFCEKLKVRIKPEHLHRKAREEVVIDIKGNKISIDDNNMITYEEHFFILNEYNIYEPSYDKNGFFRGTNNSWGAFNQHWDFERNYYSGEKEKKILDRIGTMVDIKNLKNLTIKLLEKTSPFHNKILFIPGIPGIGKSVMSKRLAYDIYKLGYPVIYCPNWRKLREHILVQFYKEINSKLSKIEEKSDLKPKTKFLLIIDDASQAFPTIYNIVNSLIDQNVPILVICFDRLGEWNSRKKYLRDRMDINDICELVPIDFFMDKSEKNRFKDHLIKIDLLEIQEEFDFDSETTFFGLMYSLVHPSKQRFHEIIKNQFNNLSTRARELFKIICIIHQYNLSVNIELLARIMESSWKDVQEILEDECSGIIQIEENEEDGIISYKTHHRIIASKTIEFFFPDPQEQTEILKQIFEKTLKKIDFERNLCHCIAINHLSQKKEETHFSMNQLDDIFGSLCSKDATSSLLHHYALIKYELKDYEEAIKLCKESLKLIQIEKYNTYSERPNFVLNTWGMIEAERGFIFQEKQDHKKAEMCFNQAARLFHEAKKISPSDSYPYFTEAYIFYRRGNKCKNNSDKIEFYSKALEILDLALSYVDKTSYEFYLKTKVKILAELENIPSDEILKIARELANYDKSLYGYYIYAYSKLDEILQKIDVDSRGREAEELLKLLNEALEINENDSSCLNLVLRIIENIFPEKLEDVNFYFEILNRLFSNPDYNNPKQLYDFGVLCFKKGYYEKGRRIFRKLKISSKDIPRRFMIRDKLDIIFEGEIDNADQYRGAVVSSKPHIKFKIYFNPLHQNHIFKKGDIVTFRLGFNYLGPIAIDIKHV